MVPARLAAEMKVSEPTKARLLQQGQSPNLKDDLLASVNLSSAVKVLQHVGQHRPEPLMMSVKRIPSPG